MNLLCSGSLGKGVYNMLSNMHALLCVCVGGRERERVCVCVCVCERERERGCVCVREREKERGSEGERERVYMFVHECTVWSFSFGFTMKSGGRGGYLILHCHQKNYAVLSVTLSPPKLCCVKMGSVVNNFNISLMVRGNVAKSP